MDMQKFIAGNVFDAYKTLGCHLEVVGAVFRTYAPNASRVSLIGEFSGWKELDMFRDTQSGIWECYVSSAEADMMYKYRIYDSNGYATNASCLRSLNFKSSRKKKPLASAMLSYVSPSAA